ncbi:MAG: hypothetical protein GY835_00075 [bacterium]|nr:hypothetical protein [bacterium]
MKRTLFLVVLLLPSTMSAQSANGQTVNKDTVPGFQGTTLPERSYSNGLMNDDAEKRVMWGKGQDGEAARTVTGGAPVRPKIKVDRTESWYTGAAKGEKSPKDFFSVMKDSYGDCTGGDSNTIPALNAYDYNCRSSLTVCRKMRVMSCSRRGWGCLKLLSVGDKKAGISTYPPHQDIIGGITRFFYSPPEALAILGNVTKSITKGSTYYEELKFQAFKQEVTWFGLYKITHKDPVELSLNGVTFYSNLNRNASDGWVFWNRFPDVDLHHHLVDGVNTFRIYYPRLSHGRIRVNFFILSNCCKALSDTWRETCP